ncbi:EAL domain-containing protein [Variovorax sp. H27-G14]|uniref:EAL domain-containing protein n=1 Tax=Variovorax sp. H27-G14 TaxID=3111914 RepID=UPI0038FC1F3A
MIESANRHAEEFTNSRAIVFTANPPSTHASVNAFATRTQGGDTRHAPRVSGFDYLDGLNAKLRAHTAAQQRAKLGPTAPSAPAGHSTVTPTPQEVVAAVASGDGLRVVFQPQHDLRTGRIVSAEALVRWTHPQHGEVSPSVLIPLVNQLGLGLLLFRLVQRQTVDMLLSLDQMGIQIPNAVNACARTLCTPWLADQLSDQMRSVGLPTRLLKLELTEDVQPPCQLALSASLAAFRSKGFAVSLDDFGSGWATLETLSSLPLDEMKIDAALVQGISRSASECDTVKQIIDLADRLSLRLVAEGIEDEATASLLVALGCRTGQGYLLSRPLEADVFFNKFCLSQ